MYKPLERPELMKNLPLKCTHFEMRLKMMDGRREGCVMEQVTRWRWESW